MNAAAIGMRMHSGWGALVVVSGDPPEVELLDRRPIVLTDPQVPGAKQPYHFAAEMELPESEKYLRMCTAASADLALAAVRNLIHELHSRQYRIIGSAVLLASGRPLSTLSEILSSHALIHTAEGEFFRKAVWTACERLNLPVSGFRERDLDEEAQVTFGHVASHLQRRIASLGKSLGSPWTVDQKKASLAASIVLSNGKKAS
jgi:hypothetical protein